MLQDDPKIRSTQLDQLLTNRDLRNVPGAGPLRPTLRVKAGTPTDADYRDPVDGLLVLDTAGSKIWVRLGGVWKSVGVV